MYRSIVILAGCIIVGRFFISCGEEKVPFGGFCNEKLICQSDLVCIHNTCINKDVNDCNPPCENDQTCVDGECKNIGDSEDKDGDGHTIITDCNDFVANIHPGAFEYCDGVFYELVCRECMWFQEV